MFLWTASAGQFPSTSSLTKFLGFKMKRLARELDIYIYDIQNRYRVIALIKMSGTNPVMMLNVVICGLALLP
jgi:hypothetical protein